MSASASVSNSPAPGRTVLSWITAKGYRYGPDGKLYSPASAARRERELVKSNVRRPVRSSAPFPNISNDLRNHGAPFADGLSSRESAPHPKPSISTPLQPVSTPSPKRHSINEKSQKQHVNDNVERPKKRQKNDVAQKRITSPKSKIADDVLSAFRKLESLAGNDRLHAFTLRIDQKLLENEETPANYMTRRIARELKNRLGRSIPFSGVVEWRTEGRPALHIHGVIPLAPGEEKRASEALRAAGGRWRDKQGRARQVDVRPIDPQLGGISGWARYCSKDTRQTQAELSRRRQALDPQQQHHRAPNLILRSGLQDRRADLPADEKHLIDEKIIETPAAEPITLEQAAAEFPIDIWKPRRRRHFLAGRRENRRSGFTIILASSNILKFQLGTICLFLPRRPAARRSPFFMR